MNHDHHDEDLRAAFRQLRDQEAQAAGTFEAPVEARGSWKVRRGTIGAGIVGTALLACLLVFSHSPSTPEQGPVVDVSAPTDIPFEDFSNLIDEEMRVASLSEWRAPTSFLLDPGY